MKAKHMKVFGRVQGVLFRDSTHRRGKKLGLKGYVENCSDGSVEIVMHGSEEKCKELIEWAKKGPPFARVDHFQIDEIEIDELKDFSMRL